MGVKDKKADKASEPAEKKVSRKTYEVLYAKNFGKGMKRPGDTVELSDKAGEFYSDQGIVKLKK